MHIVKAFETSTNCSWWIVPSSISRYVLSCFIGEEDDLDCTVRENALQVLGLTEEEAQNREFVQKRFEELSKCWNERIVKAEASEPLKNKFTQLLNRTIISYNTVKQG